MNGGPIGWILKRTTLVLLIAVSWSRLSAHNHAAWLRYVEMAGDVGFHPMCSPLWIECMGKEAHERRVV